MTKISRIPLEKEKMSLFMDDFWTAIASLQSKNEARNFFNQFFTQTERKMFAKRFQISLMLLLKYDYRSIKSRAKVSNETIAKINNWLQENREELIKVGQRVIRLKGEKAQRLESGYIGKPGKISTGLAQTALEEIIKKAKMSRKSRSLTD